MWANSWGQCVDVVWCWSLSETQDSCLQREKPTTAPPPILSKAYPGIQGGSERKPPTSLGQSKAMALAKFVFDVLTLFLWLPLPISLDKLVLPLGRTEAQSYPREGSNLWRSFCHIPSFDMWESEAQRGQELAGGHTAGLRSENSYQQSCFRHCPSQTNATPLPGGRN